MQAARLRSLIALMASVVLAANPARAGSCQPDGFGSFICGEGKEAFRVFADTLSPSKALAFAWRNSIGLPRGTELPGGDIENLLVRLEDGKVLARLGGQYWNTGESRAHFFQAEDGIRDKAT